MKRIFLALIVLLCTSCASFVQNTVMDSEYQARALARRSYEHIFNEAGISDQCQINDSVPLPKIVYQESDFVQLACNQGRKRPIEVGGCYIPNGNIILVKKWAQGGGQVLHNRYKILVHEYSHFYEINANWPAKCVSEVAAYNNSQNATESLILFRPGL